MYFNIHLTQAGRDRVAGALSIEKRWHDFRSGGPWGQILYFNICDTSAERLRRLPRSIEERCQGFWRAGRFIRSTGREVARHGATGRYPADAGVMEGHVSGDFGHPVAKTLASLSNAEITSGLVRTVGEQFRESRPGNRSISPRHFGRVCLLDQVPVRRGERSAADDRNIAPYRARDIAL